MLIELAPVGWAFGAIGFTGLVIALIVMGARP